MKIDFSKWVFIVQPDGYSMSVENPTEGSKLFVGIIYMPQELDTFDDPMKFLKLLARREIRRHYLMAQGNYNVGKPIPVQDNLDYVEEEAERRGL